MLDINDLPYTEKRGPMPAWFMWLSALLSAGMLVIHFWHPAFLPTYSLSQALTPVAMIGALNLLHYCIRSAVHEALREASSDDALDDFVVEQTAKATRSTLTPATLSRAIGEMSQ